MRNFPVLSLRTGLKHEGRMLIAWLFMKESTVNAIIELAMGLCLDLPAVTSCLHL